MKIKNHLIICLTAKRLYNIAKKPLSSFPSLSGLAVALLLLPLLTFAQNTAINEDNSDAHPSAALDVSSSDKGFLAPRMTAEEIASIDDPANGLIVFSTTDEKFYAYILAEDIWKEFAYGTAQAWACGDVLTDSRDSQTYNTVQIGTQCWMAENLNIGTMINGSTNMTDNGTIEKYCYNNNTANCDTYGGLYQWDEVMQYVTTEGAQGICPDGWHVPSTDDFWLLSDTYLGGNVVAGGKMKETGTTHWNSPNTGATNSSGFTALPGGSGGGFSGTYDHLGTQGKFWTSTQYNSANANNNEILYNNTFLAYLNNGKILAFSLRCINNNTFNQPPAQPSNPSPTDGSSAQSVSTALSWSCTDPESDPLTYDVYFGETNPPDLVNSSQSVTTYDPGTLNNSTIYYWKIVAHDDQTNSSVGPVWSFTTEAQPWACGDPFTDSRDGQTYTTVQIGTQCWMAENLNIGIMINVTTYQTNNGTIEKYCYDNNTAYCDTYGGFYQWDEMMNYSTTPGVQGICPDGWYLPTDGEYTTLANFLGGENVAGGKMKETGTTYWNTPNTGATNSSGFSGRGSGYRYVGGAFSEFLNSTWIWCSSEYDISNAWSRRLSTTNTQIMSEFSTPKGHGFVVRCLKD